MNLQGYIQGNRKGKEANRIEKEAMRDPFLADALEGYEAVPGDHTQQIVDMQKRIRLATGRSHSSGHKYLYTGIAAGLLLCFTIGGYFLMHRENETLIAMSEEVAMDMTIIAEPESAAIPSSELNTVPLSETAAPPSSRVPATSTSSLAINEADITKENDIRARADASDVVRDEKENVSKTEMAVTRQAEQSEQAAIVKLPEEVIAAQKYVVASRSVADLIEAEILAVPAPQIGMDAYLKYLKEATIPLQKEACDQTTGIVEVEFTIRAGKPTAFVIKQSLCEAADKEAIRLIENGSLWIGEDGQKVTLKVNF